MVTSSNTRRRKKTSAWIVFSTEERPRIAEENKGLSFQLIAKLLAERYKSLSVEAKKLYEEKAQRQNEAWNKEQEEADVAAGENLGEDQGGLGAGENLTDLAFPIARIKRIVKMDKDVKAIGKEGLLLVTKATELFLEYIGSISSQVASSRGGRTVRGDDISNAIHSEDSLYFLRYDFPKVVKAKKVKSQQLVNSKSAPMEYRSSTSFMNFFSSGKANGVEVDGEDEGDNAAAVAIEENTGAKATKVRSQHPPKAAPTHPQVEGQSSLTKFFSKEKANVMEDEKQELVVEMMMEEEEEEMVHDNVGEDSKISGE